MDLSTTTIKRLFEKQVKALTQQTCQTLPEADLFDFQLSGGWLR